MTDKKPNTSAQADAAAARANPQLYPIAVLIDELKCEDQKKRIAAVKSLSTISVALGPERTRNELLPYILELLDDDEEVLINLAESLGSLLSCSGGPAHAEHLLRVLEKLCAIEESSVREKATESMKKILASIRIKDFEACIMAMLGRLTQGEIYTTKMAAVQLVPVVYTHFQSHCQQELMEMFNSLSSDEMPQVRKQASLVLNEMIKLIPKVQESELLNIFSRFYKDEQDSVRMQGIDSCVCFAQHLPPTKVNAYLLPYIKKFAEDKSWRIRYLVADRIMDLAAGIGFEQAKDSLLPYFAAFLKDVESEVRTAAVGRISDFCQILDDTSIIAKIIPCLKELQADQFIYVRSALAENLLSICPLVGKSVTNEQILPVFLTLIRDESSEVRLNLFKRLEDLNAVMGVEELHQSIIPSLQELARDKNWRMKQSVIEQFPVLARQLGEPFFNEKLSPICFEWMKDNIFTIRESAIDNMKQLTIIFGEQWAQTHILGLLLQQHRDTNYLHRLTALFGMAALAEQLNFEIIKRSFLPVLQTMQKDPVANVRMNVAKTIEAILPALKGNKDLNDSTRVILRTLATDPDTDVVFFSSRALKKML